jgi:GABA(A) receptor-associated protein
MNNSSREIYERLHLGHDNEACKAPDLDGRNRIVDFKEAFPFEVRRSQSTNMLEKHPGKVPVIVERAAGATDLEQIDRKKFLVPRDMCIGQMACVIRKRLHLPPEQALYLFVGGKIKSVSSSLASVYAQDADADGFLYITFNRENTFGGMEPVERAQGYESRGAEQIAD